MPGGARAGRDPTCEGRRGADVLFGPVQLLLHLPAVGFVLANDGAAFLQLLQSAEGGHLVSQPLPAAGAVGRDGHGEQDQDLGQVVLYHVPDDPVLVVELGAA